MPEPKTGGGASAPSPWLTFVVPLCLSLVFGGGGYLVGYGRESGSVATEMRGVQQQLSSLQGGLASATASAAAARTEIRTDLADVAREIRGLDRLATELRATQRSAEERWTEANRAQDGRITLVTEVVTTMRDALVANGLRLLPPAPRRNGSLQVLPPGPDLRPVTYLPTLRIDLPAP